jgi:GNAT superfamily N-acetyltransferase
VTPAITTDVATVHPDALAEYARVPIAFEVSAVVLVEPGGREGFRLSERPVRPYVKDYDAIAAPRDWPRRFDTSKWALVFARVDGQRVGAAAIARDTPGLEMLEGRTDIAALWDIRVAPAWRRTGIGTMLFEAAEAWARGSGCRLLKIETQDTNVPACRFYARRGCVLRAANCGVYPDFPDEIQLLWHKDLSSSPAPTEPATARRDAPLGDA